MHRELLNEKFLIGWHGAGGSGVGGGTITDRMSVLRPHGGVHGVSRPLLRYPRSMEVVIELTSQNSIHEIKNRFILTVFKEAGLEALASYRSLHQFRIK